MISNDRIKYSEYTEYTEYVRSHCFSTKNVYLGLCTLFLYDGAMFWFYTTIQAIVFDANNFCNRISQLTQLTSPERLDQMKYVEQREESLQQIGRNKQK